jgi:hypothetical protein
MQTGGPNPEGPLRAEPLPFVDDGILFATGWSPWHFVSYQTQELERRHCIRVHRRALLLAESRRLRGEQCSLGVGAFESIACCCDHPSWVACALFLDETLSDCLEILFLNSH